VKVTKRILVELM